LLRDDAPKQPEHQKSTTENEKKMYIANIIRYICDHLDEDITLGQICSQFSVGKTVFCRDIKQVTGYSVKKLIANKKLTAAKKMIREENFNFTEISLQLGFKSLHYFSTWFKKMSRLSPTQYASSIRVKYN
jgi:AraC-like DNA-binding protein